MSKGSKGSSKLMIIAWAIAMIFILFMALNSMNSDENSNEAMIDSSVLERIKPVGEVRVDGSIKVASSETSEKAERSGEEVYNAKCLGCHSSGVMGAPKYASLEDWAPRIDLGLEKLTLSAIAGKGGMPARGTCMDCSDNEIKVSVQYMLDSLK